MSDFVGLCEELGHEEFKSSNHIGLGLVATPNSSLRIDMLSCASDAYPQQLAGLCKSSYHIFWHLWFAKCNSISCCDTEALQSNYDIKINIAGIFNEFFKLTT